MGRKLDRTLAVLNGLVGQHLAATDNGLATQMGCYLEGRRVALDRESLAHAYPSPSARVVVLVHGVMCTERNFALPDGSDYGSLLARDLGFSPVYVRYNSGCALVQTGRELNALLADLVANYPRPVEELVLLGYSMGGLVLRAACHLAAADGQRWLELVRRAIYVGTPHLGAPAERVGRVVSGLLRAIDDPYTRLIAEIGDLRSDGIKDLGDADLLAAAHDAHGTASPASPPAAREPLPLPQAIEHCLIAGSLAGDRWLAPLIGDSLVPVASATYRGAAPAENRLPPRLHVTVLPGLSHVALAHHLAVYAEIKAFCEGRHDRPS